MGRTNSRVGRHLHISERTIRKHLENINGKLGTSNRVAAVDQWRGSRTHAGCRATAAGRRRLGLRRVTVPPLDSAADVCRRGATGSAPDL